MGSSVSSTYQINQLTFDDILSDMPLAQVTSYKFGVFGHLTFDDILSDMPLAERRTSGSTWRGGMDGYVGRRYRSGEVEEVHGEVRVRRGSWREY